MKVDINYLFKSIFIIICITSSMDVIFNIQIAGFSMKLVFVMLVLFSAIAIMVSFMYKKPFYRPIGYISLLVWSVLLFLFIPNTTLISRNIGYYAWFITDVAFLFTISIFLSINKNITNIIRIYSICFNFIAAIGILQFFLGLFGLDFYVTQHWANNVPRANGFSYEPSFYATYLLIPWTYSFFIVTNRNGLSQFKYMRYTFILTTMAILLSTSRIGIASIITISGGYYLLEVFVQSVIYRKLNVYNFAILGVFVCVVSTVSIWIFLNLDKTSTYLQGTGLGHTSDHSASIRRKDAEDVLQAFLNSPIIGYSLGGIPSAVGKIRGIVVTSQDMARENEGINVFLEVLAASGLIGFIFFIFFIYSNFKKVFSIKKNDSHQYNVLLKAFTYALITELLILNFSQNILRPYVWIHLGMINLLYYAFQKQFNKQEKIDASS